MLTSLFNANRDVKTVVQFKLERCYELWPYLWSKITRFNWSELWSTLAQRSL